MPASPPIERRTTRRSSRAVWEFSPMSRVGCGHHCVRAARCCLARNHSDRPRGNSAGLGPSGGRRSTCHQRGGCSGCRLGVAASGLPWDLLLTSYAVTNAWMAATFAPFGPLSPPPARLVVGWLFCGFALCYGLSAAFLSLAMWQATAGGPTHWSSTLGWLGVSSGPRR